MASVFVVINTWCREFLFVITPKARECLPMASLDPRPSQSPRL